MFKRISLLLILGILVLACNGFDKPKKPDNLISETQMSELLYDLYIVNSAKGVNKKILETNGVIPESYILTKHNIDSAQFADSNTYYTYDTEAYKAIVERVKARLEKEKQELQELAERENDSIKRRKDSIKSLNKSKRGGVKVKKQNAKGLLGTIDSLPQ